MSGLEVDRQDVLHEVAEAFARYEEALSCGDQEVLGALFWDDARVVRYGFSENLYGKAEINAFRKKDSAVPKQRRVARQQITALCADVAIVNAEIEGPRGFNRQSQTWARMKDGWKIVSAHVSRLEA